MLGGTRFDPSSTSTFAFFPLHDALLLEGNYLSGAVPSELGLLTNIEWMWLCKYGRGVYLCLEEHGLNPSSTSDFAFFLLLHAALILDDNQLSGSIPSELGLLTNLRHISLCKFFFVSMEEMQCEWLILTLIIVLC